MLCIGIVFVRFRVLFDIFFFCNLISLIIFGEFLVRIR